MTKLKCKLCGKILPDRSVEGFITHLLETIHQTNFADHVEKTFYDPVEIPGVVTSMKNKERV